MLCTKSGSTWLDRLRNAKGFPVAAAAGLDDFLHSPNSPPFEAPVPKPSPASARAPIQNEDKQLFNVMSDVLNELFNFGDKCSNSTKLTKSARKQTNPRICALSAGDAAAGKVALLRSGDSNSGVEGVKVLDRLEAEGEGAGREANLVGFSRTEVTVIDTSYESWKFEKLLYRRKNVWKVRDKKGRSENVGGGKKKRKMSAELEEGHHHGGKKSKVDAQDGDGEKQGALPPSNEVCFLLITVCLHFLT